MHDEDPKTKPAPDYPADTDWGRDDRDTEMQVATIKRVIEQRREQEERAQREREAYRIAFPNRPVNAVPRHPRLGPVSAAMLARSRAMRVLAGQDLMNDPEMMAHAIDLENRVREPAAQDFDDKSSSTVER